MIVLLTIAAMATPVMATDFSISGAIRVEGYYVDQDSAPDASSWFDQRLRLLNKFQVSDDVMVAARFDFETQWGVAGQDSYRNTPKNNAQIDHAYMVIDKDMWKLKAGQGFYGFGNYIAVDHTATGLQLDLKTPVAVTLLFNKIDENSTLTSGFTDEGATDDTNFYGVQLGYAVEDYNLKGFYGVLDDASIDDSASVIGLAVGFNVADIAFKTEFNLFGGDDGAGNDYTGTQFWIDGNTNVSEALNFGGWFMYAAGDTSDTVISSVTDDSTFNPFFKNGFAQGAIVKGGAVFSGWSTEDYIGQAGFIGLGLYGTYNASDDLALRAGVSYAMEEDDAAGDFEFTTMTVSANYKLATNTIFVVDAVYDDLSSDSMGDDDAVSLWSKLQVSF